MTRRLLGGLLVVGLVAGLGAAARAQSGEGSLVAQVLAGAEQSLGEDATLAVLRAYDRGYDVVQIIEGLAEGLVAADGTITDDEGAPVEPFREASGVIEGDTAVAMSAFSGEAPSAETIAIGLLERGIDKTTKKLDKQVDLEARAQRVSVEDLSLFTMMAVIALAGEGYSPEQIILDGLIEGRIALGGPGGLVIKDKAGETIRPDGVEPSPEQEEAGDLLDNFLGEIVDTIGGVDPRTAAKTEFKTQFRVDVEIVLSDPDSSVEVRGDLRAGSPKDKGLRGYLVGNGDGEVSGNGACYIEGGPQHPYILGGNVVLGVSGPAKDGDATLRVAITEANVDVSGDDSLCVDILRDLTSYLEDFSLPAVEIRLRDGQRGSGESRFEDASVTVTLTVHT